MKKTNNERMYPVYGVIGMVAVFLVGGIVGYIMNGSDHVNHSTMSRQDCNNIAGKIMYAANGNNPELIAQLNKVYSENCLNRVFEKPKPQKKVEIKKLPETTCEAIEELLKQNLYAEDSPDWQAHEDNARIYQRLTDKGCKENREKYLKLSQREFDIAKALKNQQDTVNENISPCQQIERVLIPELECVDGYEICGNSYTHVRNAKIYANLSERGCPENSQKYKDLAKQEIDIARALTDDNIQENQRESFEIVETYKRLQMQAEAERMIEKAKKLTNPAIDFIIELEKIIEE